MLPARVYAAEHSSCPDYVSASGGGPAYFELEAPDINESEDGWDTAERNILAKTTSMSVIKTGFPLGAAHPNYTNLKLASRGNFTVLWGGWMKFKLRYKGLAIESPVAAAPGVLAMKMRDTFSNTERSFPNGYANLPGFANSTQAFPTRINEIQVGFSVQFLSNIRMATPNVGAMPSPGGQQPTAPTWPYGWIAAPTRVYPNGWCFKSGEGERLRGTNFYLYRWDFAYEHPLQPS